MGNISETILSYLPTNEDIKQSEMNVIRERLQNTRQQLRADIRKCQYDIDRVNEEKNTLIKRICDNEHDIQICEFAAKEIFLLERRIENFCESTVTKQQLINDVEHTLTVHDEETLLEQYQIILQKMNTGSILNTLTHIKSKTSELSTMYDTMPQIDVVPIINNALLRKKLPLAPENDPSMLLYTGIKPATCDQ